ncbi:hypothetical protein BJX63DRAFT_418182 [Aspergillus granulosus]|uniref:Calpain catalytic domain-containing protein n=1 Tax=Aspergillus granulosus TaxID=176169 RepID=A0ABR4I0K4_9EURO
MATLDAEDDYADMVYTPPHSSRSGSRMRRPRQAPQENLKQFWEQFSSKFPGKVYTVLPDNPYARSKAARNSKGIVKGQDAGKSYEQAKKECVRAVDRIANECRRLNQKYSDPHFDIEMDLKSGRRNCLDGLDAENDAMRPRGVKRVTEIFENPQFYVNGPTASDVRQGRDGDCWFMAALCTMGNKEGLIDKICVRRDEQVGVYGFVFYRDGDWQQCIVDDKLYLRAADYDESVDERPIWDDINRSDTEEEYRKVWQTGSRALYFAQCVDENETWLPLLEKAYAKAHGDYSAIEGGFVGEAIEDLTGGVTTDVLTSNILDKDRFWKEELMQVNKEFLFGCGTGLYSNWLSPKYHGPPRDRKGISENHSYSIMDAKEIDGVRLLKLRNPWGKKEWSGAWSDGSEQWTPQWMEKLNHKFGNDGFFWISYDDLLKKYQHFDRTRLFGPEWTVTQQWTSLTVPWSADYHTSKFRLNITKPGPVILVVSQLDTRYFKGLIGEYDFVLKFRLQKEGEDSHDYIVRSNNNSLISRSTNAEVNLEPGSYHILLKITAYRCPNTESTEEAVIRLAPTRREKLVQIGLSYDLAHAKGIVVEGEAEKAEREEREARRREAERKKLREETKKRLQREWIRDQKVMARRQRAEERLAAKAVKGTIIQTNGRHAETESDHILADDPVESPSDIDGHENGIVAKHLKNGSVPSIKFDDSHMIDHHASRDTYSVRSSRHRSTHSLRRLRRHNHNRDSELLEGFEFDSDIDMPPEVTVPRPSSLQTSFSDDLDSKTTDPWNAVCVVGLRVYSKDEMLSVEVVRPVPEDESEAALDMDDPALSATSEKGSRLMSMQFDVVHPKPAPSGPGNVIIRLPSGPLFQSPFSQGTGITSPESNEDTAVSIFHVTDDTVSALALADMTSSTVVSINYRLGELTVPADSPCSESDNNDTQLKKFNYRYPTPVHDTLTGFDWVLETLQPDRVGVMGSHIGGSLALMLALTEPRHVHAVAALEPVCDWTSLDEFCTSSSFSFTTNTNTRRKPHRAPRDLIPLLEARERFFATPERYFDSFASPILFLRSVGKDIPKAWPRYLTGPEYPIPLLTKGSEESLDGDVKLWNAYLPENGGHESTEASSNSDASVNEQDQPPIRRRKALSRWPPYGLDYGTSGPRQAWSRKPVKRLTITLPWVRVFTQQGLYSDANTAVVEDIDGPSQADGSAAQKSPSRRRRNQNATVLTRQANEMVDVMRRACFFGRESGFANERVTLCTLGSLTPFEGNDGSKSNEIASHAGEWLAEVLHDDTNS